MAEDENTLVDAANEVEKWHEEERRLREGVAALKKAVVILS